MSISEVVLEKNLIPVKYRMEERVEGDVSEGSRVSACPSNEDLL